MPRPLLSPMGHMECEKIIREVAWQGKQVSWERKAITGEFVNH